MKHLSKFFTPPLSAEDRNRIDSVLGLTSVPYLYTERLGKLHLFSEAKHHIGLTLAGLTDEQVSFWSQSNAFAFTFVVDHLVQNANSQRVAILKSPFSTPLSLWDTLIPYPFRIYKPGDVSRSFRVSLFPQAAEASLNRLYDRLLELELLLAESEAALLWLRFGENRFPLLFHYVRGRLVRAGSSPRLYEIGYQYDSGDLQSDSLSQLMGTRASFVPVVIDTGPSPEVWERLDLAFSAAIRSLTPGLPSGGPVPQQGQESRL